MLLTITPTENTHDIMMTYLYDGSRSISAAANKLHGLPTSNDNSAGLDEAS
jgi:hypothetical protein